MMTTTYATTKQVLELLQTYYRVPDTPSSTTNEAVGTGNGTAVVFYLDHGNVIASTYAVYDNGVAVTEGTGAGKYTLDKDAGEITFGTAPVNAHAITAKYWYSGLQDTVLERIINRAEDDIDQRTGHAWRPRSSGTSSGADATAQYEYRDIKLEYDDSLGGTPVYLRRKAIYTLSSIAGDALGVWDGASYVDWLTAKTEGRGNDYYLIPEEGILVLNATERVARGVRIKYRYGETTVPRDIEDATIKLAAADILRNGYLAQLPEGSNLFAVNNRIDQWDKAASEIIKRRTKTAVPY